MLQEVTHRPYIQNFLDFASAFLFTKKVTVSELDLVQANVELLLKRIKDYKDACLIGNGETPYEDREAICKN